MIARFDIVQGTEEWHQVRYGKVGGTLSKGLFVKSDTLLIDVLSEHIEDYEPDYDSYQSADMIRGQELEPQARKELSEYIGIKLLECGWLQSEVNKLLGISVDGISENFEICAEIKCFAKKQHTKTIYENKIPDKHINQCLHYFVVNDKCKKVYFCSYRPECKVKPLFVKELTLDSEIDLGTKAKPVIKTVREWVEIARAEADKLEIDLQNAIEKISF